MATITEDYVSFETVLLLKKKGFEQVGCQKQYNTQGDLCVGYCYGPVAPTLQMAMKWLREVHNLHIEINWDKGNQLYSFQVWKPGKFQPEISSLDLWRIYKDDNYIGEWNYEQACESAIKYCLEHLI